jgi:hypothetical protein
MWPDSAPLLCFDIAAPIATPIATPIASHIPPDPKTASMAMPIPAPSAIPNPICIDGLFMGNSSQDGCPTLVAVFATGWGLGLFRASVYRRQYIGPQSLVADTAYFAQQLGHAHTRQGLEQCRNLRRHFGEVPGDLVHPSGVAVAG